VPLDLVESVEADAIRLNCTEERFDQLDGAEDVQFLRACAPRRPRADLAAPAG
jgi:hypothetical protein